MHDFEAICVSDLSQACSPECPIYSDAKKLTNLYKALNEALGRHGAEGVNLDDKGGPTEAADLAIANAAAMARDGVDYSQCAHRQDGSIRLAQMG